jgi:hypothetical protein
MPRYTFVTDSGERFEHVCSVTEYSDTLVLEDGRIAHRDLCADLPTLNRPSPSCWPMKPCVSTGVNAAQAGELRELFLKHGENVEITSGGDPVYTSARQRERCLKLRGFEDHN